MNQDDRIRLFCSELWDWFSVHKRTLPWRDLREKNIDHKAYLILVSEVMLQQTQVSRVMILYKKFIQTFPTIKALSQATNTEILIAWRGLGYNSRALRLRDTARAIVSQGGRFPRERVDLQALPGIGHYTAGALRNFAFGIPTPCLDVNIRRIIHRFFIGPEHPDGTWPSSDREMLPLAEEILLCAVRPSPLPVRQAGPAPLPAGEGWRAERAGVRLQRDAASWHAALMDFGSLVCTKNNPKWHLMNKRMQSICMAYGKEIFRTKKVIKKEPGRMMAGRFVPNRIFRGRIVEALRDAKTGLTLEALGSAAVADWSMEDHRQWLELLIAGLKKDRMIDVKRSKFVLAT